MAADLPKVIERLAFLIHTQELLNHYAPVFDVLAERGEPFDILTFREPVTVDPAQAKQWGCRIIRSRRIRRFGSQYRCMVTNHFIAKPNGDLLKTLAVENVRFMYAAGKSRHNLADWNQIYDGILAFGPHHANKFREKFNLPTVEMGYPRFDQYFNNPPDKATLQARYGCDPAKPTLVWLPTWLQLSSLGHFNDEIARLSDRHNIVVKVHPLMPKSEPARVEALKSLPLTRVIDTAENNIPLYQLADYMLFDYGGPAFGAIYAGKRFILLDVPAAENNRLTGPDSSDVLLRQKFTHVSAAEKRIGGLLADEGTWAHHDTTCREISAEFFAANHGTAARHAAEALIDRSWLKGGVRR